MVNEILSLVSLSDISSLACSNERFLYINYIPCNSTKFINSSDFIVVSLGFSMYSIISSADSKSFTSFSIWIPFISFSALIAVAKTSKTMLNSGESRKLPKN